MTFGQEFAPAQTRDPMHIPASQLRATALLLVILCASRTVHAADPGNPASSPYEGARGRASRSMNTALYGPAEPRHSSDRADDAAFAAGACGRRNRTDVEKGIAGMICGVWQLATFWYPDNDRGDRGVRED